MEDGTQKVSSGVTLVNKTGETLGKIAEMVTQTLRHDPADCRGG